MIDSFETQITSAFESLGRTLAAAGVGYDSIARLTIYLTEFGPETLATIATVCDRYLNARLPPASVVVAVQALFDPKVKIELDAIAVVP